MPNGFVAPYYRAEVSLRPNRTTRKSQHQTLIELALVPRSEVYYACPMMFSRDDVYRDVDPNTLRLVDVATAPAGYLANERHYVAFRSPSDPAPLWCSDPVVTEAMGTVAWLRSRPFEERFGKSIEQMLATLVALRADYQKSLPAIWAQVAVPHVRDSQDDVEEEDDWSPVGVPLSLVVVKATRL